MLAIIKALEKGLFTATKVAYAACVTMGRNVALYVRTQGQFSERDLISTPKIIHLFISAFKKSKSQLNVFFKLKENFLLRVRISLVIRILQPLTNLEFFHTIPLDLRITLDIRIGSLLTKDILISSFDCIGTLAIFV